MNFNSSYRDCYAELQDGILKIGNNSIERTWNLKGSIPSVISLKNIKTGKEWLLQEGCAGWPVADEERAAFWKSDMTPGDRINLVITAETADDAGASEQYLKVKTELEYHKLKIKWSNIIYPGLPVMRTYLSCELKEQMQSGGSEEARQGEYLDYLPLEAKHCRWKAVRFNDVTDNHNNLVKTEEGLFYLRENMMLEGNLLFVNELLSDEGMIFVKEGPTPLAYQGAVRKDFNIKSSNIFTCGWGFTKDELNRCGSLDTYGGAVILWNGTEGEALASLRSYHNAIHRFVPSKDAFIMSNTWGDRSKDGKICEEFILKEFEAAKLLGVNYYQIDDGWQNGTTINSIKSGGVWEGYYKINPDFWSANRQRFPNGLAPVSEAAREKGINLALWFSPDSSDDFINWEKDADTLIRLHREHGVISFKVDGIKLRSKKGEENLNKLFEKVVRETAGKVFFNLDVTAEVRNGYYGRVQHACLFLENRYTDSRNYYPHFTLRNLWMLSRYYPSYRLQVEFLNVKRNMDKYEGDLLAPAVCGIEYAFAVTMFANPLAWMELTGLDPESFAVLERLIKVYGKYQAEILSGTVLPIGDEPSGTGWTGFQSVISDDEGFILIFKEYNFTDNYIYTLWNIRNKKLKLEKLLGCGVNDSVTVDSAGKTNLELNGQFKYALYKYQVEQ